MNWEALSAVGTLAVAVVAVAPIFLDRIQKREQAVNLRCRLMTYLTETIPVIALRPEGRSRANAPLEENQKAPFRQLESLMPILTLLPAREHDEILGAIVNLILFKDAPSIPAGIADNLLKQVDQSISRLSRSKWMLDKIPKMSWNTK